MMELEKMRQKLREMVPEENPNRTEETSALLPKEKIAGEPQPRGEVRPEEV